MDTQKNIPSWAWKLCLAGAAAIWGGSFVIIKDTLNAVTPAWLMGVRFCLAGLLTAALFWRRIRPHLDRRHLAAGSALGLFYGVAFVVQNIGLDGTTPGRNAFLTATYCVMVPFINWAITRRRPGVNSIVAALLCIVGVGLLALGDDLSFYLGVGDSLTLVCAVLFAVHIALVAHFSQSHDVLTLTTIQLGMSGVVGLACAVLLEPVPDFAVFLQPSVVMSMLYLVCLSSCLCSIMQNVGQAHVPAAQAGLLLSLESVFAVIASVIFYHEALTVRLVAGFATIFLAVLASELGGTWLERRHAAREAAGH